MPQSLIIDDDDEWREQILYGPLVRLKHKVETAKNQSSALRLIDQHEFDLAVINVRLDMTIKEHMITPRWTELLDAIRQKCAKIIIVASKSFPPPIESADLIRIAFKDFHAVDFLFKEGFTTKQYLQAVEEAFKTDDEKNGNGLPKETPNETIRPLSAAHRKRLQDLLADLTVWKLGKRQERYGLLLATGLSDDFVNGLTLDSASEIAAALTINALSRVGYTVEIPECTALGLLLKYLYENAQDIESKSFCASALLEYNLTREQNYLEKLSLYLQTLSKIQVKTYAQPTSTDCPT